jgi:hypothetical protein
MHAQGPFSHQACLPEIAAFQLHQGRGALRLPIQAQWKVFRAFMQAIDFARPVVQRFRDHVDHLALALERAGTDEQLAAEHGFAECLRDAGPDDEIGAAGFILKGDEDRAAGGLRALAE